MPGKEYEMVIDMLVHPMLYGEICTPGDEPDGFGFWSREFGMAYGPHGLG